MGSDEMSERIHQLEYAVDSLSFRTDLLRQAIEKMVVSFQTLDLIVERAMREAAKKV